MKDAQFPHRFRLDEFAVNALLKNGRRVSSSPPQISARFLCRMTGDGARLAIAVPKRILKRAVDRNYVKRLVREGFRQHALRTEPVDVLMSLQTTPTLDKDSNVLIVAIHSVLDVVLLKTRAAREAG